MSLVYNYASSSTSADESSDSSSEEEADLNLPKNKVDEAESFQKQPTSTCHVTFNVFGSNNVCTAYTSTENGVMYSDEVHRGVVIPPGVKQVDILPGVRNDISSTRNAFDKMKDGMRAKVLQQPKIRKRKKKTKAAASILRERECPMCGIKVSGNKGE